MSAGQQVFSTLIHSGEVPREALPTGQRVLLRWSDEWAHDGARLVPRVVDVERLPVQGHPGLRVRVEVLDGRRCRPYAPKASQGEWWPSGHDPSVADQKQLAAFGSYAAALTEPLDQAEALRTGDRIAELMRPRRQGETRPPGWHTELHRLFDASPGYLEVVEDGAGRRVRYPALDLRGTSSLQAAAVRQAQTAKRLSVRTDRDAELRQVARLYAEVQAEPDRFDRTVELARRIQRERVAGRVNDEYAPDSGVVRRWVAEAREAGYLPPAETEAVVCRWVADAWADSPAEMRKGFPSVLLRAVELKAAAYGQPSADAVAGEREE